MKNNHILAADGKNICDLASGFLSDGEAEAWRYAKQEPFRYVWIILVAWNMPPMLIEKRPVAMVFSIPNRRGLCLHPQAICGLGIMAFTGVIKFRHGGSQLEMLAMVIVEAPEHEFGYIARIDLVQAASYFRVAEGEREAEAQQLRKSRLHAPTDPRHAGGIAIVLVSEFRRPLEKEFQAGEISILQTKGYFLRYRVASHRIELVSFLPREVLPPSFLEIIACGNRKSAPLQRRRQILGQSATVENAGKHKDKRNLPQEIFPASYQKPVKYGNFLAKKSAGLVVFQLPVLPKAFPRILQSS